MDFEAGHRMELSHSDSKDSPMDLKVLERKELERGVIVSILFETPDVPVELLITDSREMIRDLNLMDTEFEYADCYPEEILDSRHAWYKGKLVNLQHKMSGPKGEKRWRIRSAGGGSVEDLDVSEEEIIRVLRPTSFKSP